MSQRPDNNFMDPKTLVAIIFCAIVFFGWQTYLAKKYPDHFKPKTPAVEGQVAGTGETAPTSVDQLQAVTPQTQTPPVIADGAPEKVLSYESENIGLHISSLGMGIKDVQLNKYLDQDKKSMTLGGAKSSSLFEVGLVGSTTPLNFNVEKTGDNSFSGVAKHGDMTVRVDLNIDPRTTRMDTNLKVENAGTDFKGIRVRVAERRVDTPKGNFFMPNINHQELVFKTEGKIERLHPGYEDHVEASHKAVSLAAIGNQYFVSSLVDRSQILPTVESKIAPKADLDFVLNYVPATIQPTLDLHWISYVGGKSMAQLQSVDPEFTEVVNLGFFGAIGKVLLKVLHWSHDLVGNWGWAIIILTVLVRLIVLPFNVASYKSMKKMQVIQPQLQSLRERYKEDPTALNRETMTLMREAKVNPLGGCLPILLQMPVFFALYQVLGQSIELYQAPFIFWIQDLSQKDPFFVLPVLMTLVMFIQQKITPTTMDPMQAKIMLWMPVIFGVFTLGLPSGLTLYIFVSTLFGVIQQRVFMRDKSKAVTLSGAKA